MKLNFEGIDAEEAKALSEVAKRCGFESEGHLNGDQSNLEITIPVHEKSEQIAEVFVRTLAKIKKIRSKTFPCYLCGQEVVG